MVLCFECVIQNTPQPEKREIAHLLYEIYCRLFMYSQLCMHLSRSQVGPREGRGPMRRVHSDVFYFSHKDKARIVVEQKQVGNPQGKNESKGLCNIQSQR